MPEIVKSRGRIAFEAYNESKGGLTYDGKPIPPWDELSGDKEAVQRAWEAAAEAVIESLTRHPEGMIRAARRSVEAHSGKSRESSLVLTKLDEAVMWHGAIPYEAHG